MNLKNLIKDDAVSLEDEAKALIDKIKETEDTPQDTISSYGEFYSEIHDTLFDIVIDLEEIEPFTQSVKLTSKKFPDSRVDYEPFNDTDRKRAEAEIVSWYTKLV